MKLSQFGIDFIKAFEGCRLQSYKCLPSERYFTIGYGHYGPDVRLGMKITQKEADELFLRDIKRFEDAVNKYSLYNWSQNEFDSLVSFAYNIGSIDQLTDFGMRSKKTISEKMLLYNKSGGSVIQGLVNRRKAEQELFLKKDYIEEFFLPSGTPIMKKSNRKLTKVMELQHALNAIFDAGLKEDGYYGELTEKAVERVQDLGGLVVDGIYGPKTEAYIRSVLS